MPYMKQKKPAAIAKEKCKVQNIVPLIMQSEMYIVVVVAAENMALIKQNKALITKVSKQHYETQ